MSGPRTVRADIGLAERMFEALHRETFDGVGITRVAYGEGEQFAHGLVAEHGRGLGLQIAADFAGNTYVTLPGTDPQENVIVIGSHMDSVPRGGNFDGAAGVVAGLSAVSGLINAGVKLRRDITVMAVRAEESCWFPASYIGSRMALGRLPSDQVDTLRRSDTGRTLSAHMADLGLDPDAVRQGRRHLNPCRISLVLEPHIQPGAIAVERDTPTAITAG